MDGIQASLCQLLRQKQSECNMNNQSFDEDNHTVGRILSGKGGRFETACSIMEQMGITKVAVNDDTLILE